MDRDKDSRIEPRRPVRADRSDQDIIGAILSKAAAPAPSQEATHRARDTAFAVYGFDGKARVQTIFGQLPIEALRQRDSILTSSGAYRQVTWITELKFDSTFLNATPQAMPVLIGADSLSRGVPQRSFLTTQAQGVSLTKIPAFSNLEKVGTLTNRFGVSVRPTDFIRYYQFGYGERGFVNVEGVWCAVDAEPRRSHR